MVQLYLQRPKKKKQKKLNPKLYTVWKGNSKWIIDISIKCNTTKLLPENLGGNFHDLGLGEEFLDTTPKAQAIKEKIIDMLDFIKIKGFWFVKDPVKKKKRQDTRKLKICISHIWQKTWVQNIQRIL